MTFNIQHPPTSTDTNSLLTRNQDIVNSEYTRSTSNTPDFVESMHNVTTPEYHFNCTKPQLYPMCNSTVCNPTVWMWISVDGCVVGLYYLAILFLFSCWC